MITELFSMLSSIDIGRSGNTNKFNINLNRNHIRSISAYSSNSIFYFTTIVTDQATPEELGMVSRVLEKSYASFVVTCISLMPFHRVRADDQASIEDYLSQFHQNLGIKSGGGAVMSKVLGLVDTLEEAAVPINEKALSWVNDDGVNVPRTCPDCGSAVCVSLHGEPVYMCTNNSCKKDFGVVAYNETAIVDEAAIKATQDFLLECWEKSRKADTDFIKVVTETVSLNDMYQVDPIDPVTRVMQETYFANLKELNTWGFLGEATADMFDDPSDEELVNMSDAEIINSILGGGAGHYGDDDDDDEDLEDEYEEIDGLLSEGNVKSAINSIMFSLESVSENKILSCSNLTKLKSLEAKLNKLKNKYAKYLSRYKKKHKENEKTGSKSKLAIRFNGATITNPKAFMKQYGSYIKIINKRLKLVDKRRTELRKRKGLPDSKADKLEESALTTLSDLDLQVIDHCIAVIDEAIDAPDDKVFILVEAKDWSKATPEEIEADAQERVRAYWDTRDRYAAERENDRQADMAWDYVHGRGSRSRSGSGSSKSSSSSSSGSKASTGGSSTPPPPPPPPSGGSGGGSTPPPGGNTPPPNDPWEKKYRDLEASIQDKINDAFKRGAEKAGKDASGKIKQAQKNQRTQADNDRYKELLQARKDLAEMRRLIKENRNLNKQTREMYQAKIDEMERKMEILKNGGSDPDQKSDFEIDGKEFTVTFDPRKPKSGLNLAKAAAQGYEGRPTFDKEIFTNMEMKKANEALPTFAKASIGFIVDETEQVVHRDVLVGVKVQLHKIAAKDLIDDIYNCIINKRQFLKFVKFISGEEKSLADLLFGFKELKLDAVNSSGARRWNAAFRRRRRWAKASVPYLMKNYTPNGTVVITMNEVQFIRDEYGVDIMIPEHVEMLMDAGFLLGFVVLDQANEMCYITYDGYGGNFQEYTYAMLEREQQSSDRMIREMYRAMSR